MLKDEYALTIEDDHPGERRFVTQGMNAAGSLLVVVYGYRTDGVMLISAHRVTTRERKPYEAGL